MTLDEFIEELGWCKPAKCHADYLLEIANS